MTTFPCGPSSVFTNHLARSKQLACDVTGIAQIPIEGVRILADFSAALKTGTQLGFRHDNAPARLMRYGCDEETCCTIGHEN